MKWPIVLKRASIAILLLGILLEDPVTALASDAFDLAGMSLEELMDVEVFTASRGEESLFESAAAVEVITGEEIRRSGVTRLPEALRLACGVHYKEIDASKWAIAVRGFNNRFVNKLLVLIDGRTVYSPLFSGVWWEVQDLLLENVDRIEVVRGPGGTLWGANAVNGVINIITRPAEETQGSTVWVKGGPEERGFGALQHGGRFGENAFYRIYGKGFRRDTFELETGGRAADSWNMLRGGFRIDGERSGGNWMLSGEAYDGRMSQTVQDGVSLTPPYSRSFDAETDLSGTYLLGRYARRLSAEGDLRLTGYYDWSRRSNVEFDGYWHVVGLDLQQRMRVGGRQSLVWGGELRSTWDNIERTERFTFDPQSRNYQVFSGFLQDEIRFLDGRLRLILGAKLEHNDFTGVEVLPNVRGVWTDHRRHTVWGAVSRAVRLPTRAEEEGQNLRSVSPLSADPESPLLVVHLKGNPHMKAEELLAWELGYRFRPAAGLTLDLGTFYNRYDHLLSGAPESIFLDTTVSPQQLVTFFTGDNGISGETLGGEVNVEWKVCDRWRLRGGYAYLYMDMTVAPGKQDFGMLEFVPDNPRHRGVLRSLLDLTERVELDAVLRYTSELLEKRQERMVALDMRLGWKLLPEIELALVGQYLLGAGYVGLDPELIDTLATHPQRSVFASLRWQFRGR